MNKKSVRSGQAAPNSGQYEEVGPRGGHIGREVTAIQGKPMPPTSRSGNQYVLVDPTNNGSGRGKR